MKILHGTLDVQFQNKEQKRGDVNNKSLAQDQRGKTDQAEKRAVKVHTLLEEREGNVAATKAMKPKEKSCKKKR